LSGTGCAGVVARRAGVDRLRHMGKVIDLMGRVFGRLTVTGRAESQGTKARWHCQCECGRSSVVLSGSLVSGKSLSCGCLRLEGCAKLVPDLSGQTFGRLTVLRRVENDKHDKTRWLCRCECGTEAVRSAHLMRKGESLSCGCLQRETNVSAPTRHGNARVKGTTREYEAWSNMVARCENPKATHFECYGGRGISVCARWRNDFVAFLADMGPKPSPWHSIDRYPDNDGNYEPGNCRWATVAQQSRNKRTNRFVTFGGETLTLADWGERYGVSGTVIGTRLRLGWSVERSITEPLHLPRVQREPSRAFNFAVAA
jgi:hypothetical protein